MVRYQPLFYTRHSPLLQAAYSELKRRAMEQTLALVGSAGSLGERAVSGRRFYYRQYYDAEGHKSAAYIGPVGNDDAERRARAVRDQIELTGALVKEARLLAQQGYVRVDSRTRSLLASLANHGCFRAGAVLVGSHAYGALLAELGVRAAAFRTEDVDIARARALAPPPRVDFAQMLVDSTVVLRPVPGLDRKAPPTSYKAPGGDRFRVDLLASSGSGDVSIRAAPELGAHAMGVPHLDYLVDDPIDSVVLGRDGVVAVRVPRPEAFAWHKMLSSELRGETRDKRTKDLAQAAVMFAVLAEDAEGGLRDAFTALPRGTRAKVRAAAKRVAALLDGERHDRAAELLKKLA